MKEKKEYTGKDLSKTEACNLSVIEFKVMDIMVKEVSENYRNLVGPASA